MAKKLKLKREPEEQSAGPEAATQAPVSPAPPAPTSGKVYTLSVILAGVAAVCFIVLIFLQFRETSFYNQPPPAFPPAAR
mgnify:CR=1 FL=1